MADRIVAVMSDFNLDLVIPPERENHMEAA
jgi:hypothetical protein